MTPPTPRFALSLGAGGLKIVAARSCRKCGAVVWPTIRGDGEEQWPLICPATLPDGRRCKARRWDEPADSIPKRGRPRLTPEQRAERVMERARAQAAAIREAAGLG